MCEILHYSSCSHISWELAFELRRIWCNICILHRPCQINRTKIHWNRLNQNLISWTLNIYICNLNYWFLKFERKTCSFESNQKKSNQSQIGINLTYADNCELLQQMRASGGLLSCCIEELLALGLLEACDVSIVLE